MDTSVPTSETLAQQQAQQHPSSVSGGPYVSAFPEVYPPLHSLEFSIGNSALESLLFVPRCVSPL